jgi:hypothetical protein
VIELPPFHSITSSARASSVVGTAMPSIGPQSRRGRIGAAAGGRSHRDRVGALRILGLPDRY